MPRRVFVLHLKYIKDAYLNNNDDRDKFLRFFYPPNRTRPFPPPLPHLSLPYLTAKLSTKLNLSSENTRECVRRSS